MSRWCDHVACTKDLLDWFLWAARQDEPTAAVGEIIGHVYKREGVLRHECNHLWEGVHRVLTDDDSADLDFDAGDHPLRLCIHGGEWLLEGQRTMTLIEADEVPALAEALRAIDQAWVVDRLAAMQQRTSPRYDRWNVQEYGEDTWYQIEALREFYEAAARAKLPVICTISH